MHMLTRRQMLASAAPAILAMSGVTAPVLRPSSSGASADDSNRRKREREDRRRRRRDRHDRGDDRGNDDRS